MIYVDTSSEMTAEEILEELEHLWRTSPGDSAGHPWTREQVHERAASQANDRRS